MENKVRSFISLNFPEEIIKEIARVQLILLNQKFTGKLTELPNLHLTLKFLGEIPEQKINELKERLKRINFAPFEATLGEAGIFSFRKNPRIVWVKINGQKIWDLQKKIDLELKEIFPEEQRFMSHCTIARIKYVKNINGFAEYIKNLKVKPLKFKIDSFALNSSELNSLGPIYQTIEKYPLTEI